MPKASELIKESGELAALSKARFEEARKKADAEKRDLTDDEVKSYKEPLARAKALAEQARDIGELETIEASATESRGRKADPDPAPAETRGGNRRPEITDEQRCLAIAAWMKRNLHSPREITESERDACKALRSNPDASEFVIRLAPAYAMNRGRRAGWAGGHGVSFQGAEERAMSALVGSSGGFYVGDTLLTQLEVNMLAYGSVMQVAGMLRTATGEPLSWPTVDYTTTVGSQVGESAVSTTGVAPSAGRVTWGAYKFTSNACLVPTELLEDSIFDVPTMVGQMLGEALGRILNQKFTTGSGAATPNGIVTAATAATLQSTGAATTASATAITWDEITDLIHSIDPALRPGSAFMFSDPVYQHIRKLKDGMGRPLWADGPNSTPPALLQGYPYYINQDMATSVAANNATMIFGRLEKYKVRQVNEVRLYRMTEAYRLYDQDAFLAFIRADGNLLTAGTAPIKKLVQHA